jgi:hypothetical protein
MGFRILQRNFDRPPTTDQRKVLDLFGLSGAGMTRIEAHLKIREKLQGDPMYKQRLAVWRQARADDRRRRREGRAQPG